MTTPLVRPLTREILVDGAAYRVTLTADRLLLAAKGRHKGIEVTWDELLARDEDAASSSAAAPPAPPPRRSDLPRSVLTAVARDLRAASAALNRADEALVQAGALPEALLAELSADPTAYGRAGQRDDWFVEPLLTVREVASILRLSTRAVRKLPLRTIAIAGELRYRQSELREFLRKQEGRTR